MPWRSVFSHLIDVFVETLHRRQTHFVLHENLTDESLNPRFFHTKCCAGYSSVFDLTVH
jgi:hypothetical protein